MTEDKRLARIGVLARWEPLDQLAKWEGCKPASLRKWCARNPAAVREALDRTRVRRMGMWLWLREHAVNSAVDHQFRVKHRCVTERTWLEQWVER